MEHAPSQQQQVQRDNDLPRKEQATTTTPATRDTRSEPIPLDDELLKQIGGGNSTGAPHGNW